MTMTRQEAKEYWTATYEAARNWDDPHWEASERKDHRRYVDALKAAIEALSEHNCVKCKHYYETEEDWGVEGHCKMDTAHLPERTGEWIFNPKDAIELMFTKPKCSKCGFESADGGNFCSNCGARMTPYMRGDTE